MMNYQQTKEWLLARTVTPDILKKYRITFNGKIVIPYHDEKGNFMFNKYRRNPADEISEKYIYDKGSKAMLFGTEFIDKTKPVILCEGELDVLALVSHGFQAVSSSSGCKTFKWPEYFDGVETYICYDTDFAGREGALKVFYQLKNAKIINLPNGKDVTEYFVSGKTSEDFSKLVAGAVIYPRVKKHFEQKKTPTEKVASVKQVPMTDYIKFDEHNKACCLWHQEKTPSLVYYPKENNAFCFGCGRTFDVIDCVQIIQGVKFNEAVTYLKQFVTV